MSTFNIGPEKEVKEERGFVSVVNSSKTPLTGDAVFTGQGEPVYTYATITVFVDTDVDGTLSMQFSSDKANWDRAKVVSVDQTLGSGSVHTLETVSKYFRVVYTNGSSAQGHFRLQTIYHSTRSGFLTSSPDERISKTNDAQIVRVSNDPFLDISRSLYKDKIPIHKFGANPTTPSGERDIWGYGSTSAGDVNYNWLTSDAAVRIKAGGNAADASGGNGARSITVEGLDENWAIASESITCNADGTLASSATTTTFIRVSRAYVATCGTYTGSNTGAIVIETTGGTVVAYIPAGLGQTEMSMYSVPANYTAYLRHAHGSVNAGTNKESTITFYKRENGNTVAAPFKPKRIVHQWEALQGVAELDFYSSVVLPPYTDFWATSEGAVSSASVNYDLFLVKDEAGMDPQ